MMSHFSTQFSLDRRVGMMFMGIMLISACTTSSSLPQAHDPVISNRPIPELIRLDQSLSIEAAYQAIPHQRTPFSLEKTYINDDAAERLHRFFELTDMAVVERVHSLKTMYSGNLSYYSSANYESILKEIEALDLPTELSAPKQLVMEAIQEQQAYFEQWYHSGERVFHNVQHSLVQSSHSKLIQAYNQIMAAYPHESQHNKTAFFDHLCALDFI